MWQVALWLGRWRTCSVAFPRAVCCTPPKSFPVICASKGGMRRHTKSAVWHFPGWLLTSACNTPPKNKIGEGACEWLAKLLRGGHMHAITQWPTTGDALERALQLV